MLKLEIGRVACQFSRDFALVLPNFRVEDQSHVRGKYRTTTRHKSEEPDELPHTRYWDGRVTPMPMRLRGYRKHWFKLSILLPDRVQASYRTRRVNAKSLSTAQLVTIRQVDVRACESREKQACA